MPKHCSLLYTHINNDVDYIYPCCALEKSLVPQEEMIPATPENFSKALTMPLFERIRKHTGRSMETQTIQRVITSMINHVAGIRRYRVSKRAQGAAVRQECCS